MTTLEVQAREVAKSITPENEGDKGIDFISIASIVVTIIQGIIQACPKNPAQVAADLRRPGIMQRAVLRKRAMEVCEAEGTPHKAREVYKAMMDRASSLSEADALAIVKDAQSDGNLLV